MEIRIRVAAHVAPAKVIQLHALAAKRCCELPGRTRSRLAMANRRSAERFDFRIAQAPAPKDVVCRRVRRGEPPTHDLKCLAHRASLLNCNALARHTTHCVQTAELRQEVNGR